jgi:hypothetical protein
MATQLKKDLTGEIFKRNLKMLVKDALYYCETIPDSKRSVANGLQHRRNVQALSVQVRC